MGHDAIRLPGGADCDDLDDNRQPDQPEANAKFDFGLAPYPGKIAPASVLGGGNLYIFKRAPAAEKEAAMKFIKFLTSDEILADWSIKTGYVAPRDGAWDTEA